MASINVGSSGGSIATVIGIVIFIIAIIVIWKRNPNFLSNLFGGGTGHVGAAVGATIPGPNIYQAVGDIPRSGDFGRSDANSGTSFRDNISFPCDKCARETTWIVTPGTGGGGGSTGEDLTVKMGSHGKESDPTALISFGGVELSGGGGKWKSEGPHGTDAGVSGSINEGSLTPSGDQPMGIKGISWPIDNNGTQHHEIWTSSDDGANWTCTAVFEGTTEGSNPLTCPIPGGEGNCQDTLRIDGSISENVIFHRRTMVEINPGDGTPVGGGNPPAEIPTQDRGGGGGGDDGGGEEPEPEEPEEEEPEEEEPEDGEDGEGDGGGQMGGCDTETKVCTCPNGASIQLLGSETCAQCTNKCGGGAAAARRPRSRRGNIGRRALYSHFSSRFYPTTTYDVRVFRAGSARICM